MEFKNNVKKAWWKRFIQEDPHNVGIQSAILMNPQVLGVASGHVGGFSDPLMDCKQCKTRAFVPISSSRPLLKARLIPSGWSN